jgi:hypothetical protein
VTSLSFWYWAISLSSTPRTKALGHLLATLYEMYEITVDRTARLPLYARLRQNSTHPIRHPENSWCISVPLPRRRPNHAMCRQQTGLYASQTDCGHCSTDRPNFPVCCTLPHCSNSHSSMPVINGYIVTAMHHASVRPILTHMIEASCS